MLHVSIFPPSVWMKPLRCVLSVPLMLPSCFWICVHVMTRAPFAALTNSCDVCCAQLWLRDSQSGSRAPAPSCLAGRTRPCSGGWLRGGRRWAGSRRRWTCSRSGPTLGRSHRSSSASRVSRAGRERKTEFICLTYFCGLMFWSLKGRLDCLCVRIIQRRWLCVCVYRAACYSSTTGHLSPLLWPFKSPVCGI